MVVGDSPAETDGYDSGAVVRDLEEHGHGEVEVGPRRVTPTSIVAWLSEVGGAEIGCSDEDGGAPREAPLGFVVTLDLETSTAAQSVVEQSRAQRRRVHSVPLTVQVSIPTSTT